MRSISGDPHDGIIVWAWQLVHLVEVGGASTTSSEGTGTAAVRWSNSTTTGEAHSFCHRDSPRLGLSACHASGSRPVSGVGLPVGHQCMLMALRLSDVRLAAQCLGVLALQAAGGNHGRHAEQPATA